MPLKAIKHLQGLEKKLGDWRSKLSESPLDAARAEQSYQTFQAIVDKLYEQAPRIYEVKGLQAGLKLSKPIIEQHQQMVRKKIEDEVLDPDIGKPIIKKLAEASQSVKDAWDQKRDELHKVAGKYDGLLAAAQIQLEQIQAAVDHYRRQQRMTESDEEHDLWGTENGQRPSAEQAAQKKPRRKKPAKSQLKAVPSEPSEESGDQ